MPGSITSNLRGLIVLAALTLNTILWFLPLFFFALVKLLVPHRGARRGITRLLMTFGEFWVDGNAFVLGLRRPGSVETHGLEALNPRGWYLVIANHQTWSDIVILQTIFNRRIPFLKFFIKQELIWFPLLGVAWWALDMPFMKRYSKSYLAKHPQKKGLDLKATEEACKRFSDTPTSVINFVEGTRFSIDKRDKRASPYNHLLPPRAGGIALALSSMGSMFDAILDVTVVYPGGVVSFWEMCCGGLDRVVIAVEKRPVEDWMLEGDYARDRRYRAAFHQWLTGIWAAKDARINVLQASGQLGSGHGHSSASSSKLS